MLHVESEVTVHCEKKPLHFCHLEGNGLDHAAGAAQIWARALGQI